MEVVWAASAETDLQGILAYVAAENPTAAQGLAMAIVEAAQSLTVHPLKGHQGEDGTREWVVPGYARYLLIYDVDLSAGRIRILRVWHQSRQIHCPSSSVVALSST